MHSNKTDCIFQREVPEVQQHTHAQSYSICLTNKSLLTLNPDTRPGPTVAYHISYEEVVATAQLLWTIVISSVKQSNYIRWHNSPIWSSWIQISLSRKKTERFLNVHIEGWLHTLNLFKTFTCFARGTISLIILCTWTHMKIRLSDGTLINAENRQSK